MIHGWLKRQFVNFLMRFVTGQSGAGLIQFLIFGRVKSKSVELCIITFCYWVCPISTKNSFNLGGLMVSLIFELWMIWGARLSMLQNIFGSGASWQLNLMRSLIGGFILASTQSVAMGSQNSTSCLR